MSTQLKKQFVGGAAVLAAAGLIGKVIGAFYKIWLAGLIGIGMTPFNLAYSVYNFLLIISSAGLPTAISRMVSGRLSGDDRVGAREVVRVARRVLFLTGITASVLMLAFSATLANLAGDPEAGPAYAMISPAIFLVCMISAYRGYFQGMQRMAPTAASQLVEQVGKVAIGFPLASYGAQFSPVWGAVGAIGGVVISELAALILMLGAAAHQRSRERDLPAKGTGERGILRPLFAIAIPVTIGSAVMPIVSIADSFQVLNRLQDIGYALDVARQQYSALTTIVIPLISMPAVITLSLSTALVPAISAAMAVKNTAVMRQNIQTGIKLAVLIGLPAAVGMGMLSQPIVNFIFAKQAMLVKSVGAELLGIMAIGIFFLSLIQTTTGILQGLGKPIIPVYTMGVGIVVKILLNYILLGLPSIGIRGASIATIACYVIAAVGNVYFVIRHSGIGGRFLLFMLRPIIASGAMAGVLWLMLTHLAPLWSAARFTLIAIAAGGLVYVVAALLTRSLTRQDLALIPGGARLTRLLDRRKKA